MRTRKKGRDSAFAYTMSIQPKYQAGAVWKVSLKCSCFQALPCMWTAKLPKKHMFIHLFIQSFNEYSLSASLVPGMVLSF